ncbi:hypothetical protein VaNZ11_005019 [Volvox africanus]|uniref:Fungal lipase-type domain-containing protein n=1 Tax=Volvox africanus TaxID=51714 RepID=A0ABQ5RXS5_9CHLO|nr:hypothetical protein VaNZ11_005019 [Volvox africanus]
MVSELRTKALTYHNTSARLGHLFSRSRILSAVVAGSAMVLHQPFLETLVVALVALAAVAAHAHQPEQLNSFRNESLLAPQHTARGHFRPAEAGGGSTEGHEGVPAVFRNGAWTPDHSTNLNAYVSAILSKDVYFKHIIDPRDGRSARRNFTLFAQLFCRAMVRLGADDCELISGAESLVWAVVRAGRSVLLVIRGSNTPQNWLADVTSFRMTNVADFGGGRRGTNVALGFYKVFAANRRAILDRVRTAIDKATAAGASSDPTAGQDAVAIGGGGGGGQVTSALGDGGSGGRGDAFYEDVYGSSRARLWVFGHSLGGAVALMAASYMDIQEGLTATGVYTYGCPRVGDESWAQSYELQGVTMRLENTGDIIPMLPLGFAWRHVGASVIIQSCKDLRVLPPELLADDDVFASAVMPDGKATTSATATMTMSASATMTMSASESESERERESAVEPVLDVEATMVGGTMAEGTVAAVKLQGGATGGGTTWRRLLAGHQRQMRIGGGSESGGTLHGRAPGVIEEANEQVAAAQMAAVDVKEVNFEVAEAETETEAKAKVMQAVMVEAHVAEEEGNLDDAGVSFHFPVSFRDHWIQTYVQVMWSCLPDPEQGLVPGPEDVYDKL